MADIERASQNAIAAKTMAIRLGVPEANIHIRTNQNLKDLNTYIVKELKTRLMKKA